MSYMTNAVIDTRHACGILILRYRGCMRKILISFLTALFGLGYLPAKADVRALFRANYPQWLALSVDGKGPYEMSSLMTLHLKNLTGDGFNSALVKYYRLPATPDQTAETAFMDSFGMSEEAYIASLQTWLNKL